MLPQTTLEGCFKAHSQHMQMLLLACKTPWHPMEPWTYNNVRKRWHVTIRPQI